MRKEPKVDMSKTKYNTSEVSRLIGRGRATVSRHAKAGRISYELDENGHMLFDASEISRVYADAIQKQGARNHLDRSAEKREVDSAIQGMQDKLIGQYESRIEHLEKTLDKALDITPLLEDRSAEKHDWEAMLTEKAERIANTTERQITEIQEKHKEEVGKLMRALRREAGKTWWEKLFEKKRTGNRKERHARSSNRAG